jgi:hypothetical protein
MKEMKRDDEVADGPANGARPTESGTAPSAAAEPRKPSDTTA